MAGLEAEIAASPQSIYLGEEKSVSRQYQTSWTQEAINQRLQGTGIEYIGEAPRRPGVNVRWVNIRCRCGVPREVRLPTVVNYKKPPLCKDCHINDRTLSKTKDGTRNCTACKLSKSLEDFYKRPSHRLHESRCRECCGKSRKALSERLGRDELRQREKRFKEANPERYRLYKKKAHLRERGLTYEAWQQMIADQANLCAICGNPPGPSDKGVLHVDHCHISGAIRGLLCHFCNTGLGSFRDDEDKLLKAVVYLRKARTKTP